MKNLFKEEQIIGLLKEAEAGGKFADFYPSLFRLFSAKTVQTARVSQSTSSVAAGHQAHRLSVGQT